MTFGPPHASDADIALVRELYQRLDGVPLETLSPGEQVLFTLITAADQIVLGGFESFYYATPELAAAAPAAAEHVTARKVCALFEQANAIAFAEPPRKRSQSEFRRMMRAVESSSDRLAQLDDAFDALMADPATRIEAFLARYIATHPLEFRR